LPSDQTAKKHSHVPKNRGEPFLFTVTLVRPKEVVRVPFPRTRPQPLPSILSRQELAEIFPVFPPKERISGATIWASPSGDLMASDGTKDHVWLCDLTTGTVRQKIQPPTYTQHAAFRKDEKWLFTRHSNRVLRWNLATGQTEASSMTPDIDSILSGRLVLTPDDRTVIVRGEDGVLVELDRTTLNEQRRLRGHTKDCCGLAISPDVETLASITNEELKIWDLEKGVVRRTLPRENRLLAVAFSPSGKIVALAGRSELTLWDVESGDNLAEFPGIGSELFTSVAFSPDGALFAAGLGDDRHGVMV